MAFLLTTYGHGGASAWSDLLGSADDDKRSHLSDWQDADAAVRLGTLSPNAAIGCPVCVADDLVAAAVGQVDVSGSTAGAVLEAYRLAGIPGLGRLHGEYAYALWDRSGRILIIGCDAVGLLAPAYTWDGKTFLLSTRAVALTRQSGGPPAFDWVYLAHALSGVWARTASATAFKGVRRMSGGDLIRVSAEGVERLKGDRLTFRTPRVDDGESALRELGEVLNRAVSDKTREGPSGVALSGGVDSCVVAAVLSKLQPEIDAFSLVSPDGFPGDAPTISPLIAAFPRLRHRRVVLTGDATERQESEPIPDDPICAGPVLQAGRVALLRAVRDGGLRRLFDGEGGDELFDMAWRPGDLIREGAVRQVFSAFLSRASRRRLLRDFITSGRGPAATLLLERMKKGVRARRPWLRPEFWESSSFASAWDEAIAFARQRSARERLRETLGAHGRYWRTQELARLSVGVQGASPFLDRRVVELVGSVHASVAMDLRHGKALLRRLAAQGVPAAIAWQPKSEPLSDWLIDRWISQDANVRRTIMQIKSSALLSEHVDPAAVLVAVDQARGVARPNWLSSSIVELNAIVEWVTAVETRYGL